MAGAPVDVRESVYFYYTLKVHARHRVAHAINRKIEATGVEGPWGKVTLSSINAEATEFARLEWTKYYGPDTHEGFASSWEALHHKFAARPSYFDLAIWQIVGGRRVLQGLALGKPSNAKTRLALNWVERSFAPTYLRSGILEPVLACAQEYAKLLGSREVVIRDAVDPSQYERYGYVRRNVKYVGDVLIKELTYGEAQGGGNVSSG